MGIGDVLKIAFFVLLVLALALAIANYIQQASQPTQLVMNIPAGIYYKGPDTTAIAGYYCIENINSSNGFSIQLNAQLDNGLGIQNAYGTFVSINGALQTALLDNVWGQTSNGTLVLLHASNPSNDVVNASCAWLVIALKNGVAYFGYSLDGKSITWYDSYPVGSNHIISAMPGTSFIEEWTNIVLAGPGNGEQAQLNNALVYLALYYWNGTTWVPAPVGILKSLEGTVETVNNAYVHASGSCGGVVSWPSPVNSTECPGTPSFKP
jgi:hypothetical protein